jgi:hypothetical protein
MAGGSPLGERVARLLDPVRSRAGVPRRLMALAGTVLVATALTFGCFGGTDRGGTSAESRAAPVKAAGSNAAAPMKVWFAVGRTDSELGRRLVEGLQGEAPRSSGILVRKETWRLHGSDATFTETYLQGPRASLAAHVDSVLARGPVAGEQVLLERREGGLARTHVIDVATRIDLDRPELTVIPDEFDQPQIGMHFRPADAERINQVTAAHLGHRLLVVAGDQHVMAAPTVQSPLRDRGRITFGADTTEAQARELAAAIGAVGAEQIVFPRHVVLPTPEGARLLLGEPVIPSRIPLTAGESRWAGMSICVDQAGLVTKAEVLDGNTLEAVEQLTDAVKTWRYRPYVKDGKPTPFCYSTRVFARTAP